MCNESLMPLLALAYISGITVYVTSVWRCALLETDIRTVEFKVPYDVYFVFIILWSWWLESVSVSSTDLLLLYVLVDH